MTLTKKFYSSFKAEEYDPCILYLSKASELLEVIFLVKLDWERGASRFKPFLEIMHLWKPCLYVSEVCSILKQNVANRTLQKVLREGWKRAFNFPETGFKKLAKTQYIQSLDQN